MVRAAFANVRHTNSTSLPFETRMTSQQSAAQLPASSTELPDADGASKLRVAAQLASLPAPWRQVDRVIVKGTEVTLFAHRCAVHGNGDAGSDLPLPLQLLDLFVNAAARLLLVWFFLLGAGIALRHGAHVGFELLLSALPPRPRDPSCCSDWLLAGDLLPGDDVGRLNALGPALEPDGAGTRYQPGRGPCWRFPWGSRCCSITCWSFIWI